MCLEFLNAAPIDLNTVSTRVWPKSKIQWHNDKDKSKSLLWQERAISGTGINAAHGRRDAIFN